MNNFIKQVIHLYNNKTGDEADLSIISSTLKINFVFNNRLGIKIEEGTTLEMFLELIEQLGTREKGFLYRETKMIDANRDTSAEVLKQLKAASYERFRIELFNSVGKLLEDFDMDWDELARQINGFIAVNGGQKLKEKIGCGNISVEELNDIAHVFSAEPYMIFRPRKPWVNT